MRHTSFTVGAALTLLVACADAPLVTAAFPTDPRHDYRPTPVFARWALPSSDGEMRIWVKGSSTHDCVQIDEGVPTKLAAPTYAAVISGGRDLLSPRHRRVYFWTCSGSAAASAPTETITLRALADAQYGTGDAKLSTPFSFLAYGCLQPFTVVDDQAQVFSGEFHPESPQCPGRLDTPTAASSIGCANVLARRLLATVASASESVRYRLEPQPLAVGEWVTTPAVLARPILALGTGDQVYLDAGYATLNRRTRARHPISAWDTTRRPPQLRAADFPAFVEDTYRAFWSFDTVSAVHHAMPALLAWDDHEIRDGWGSERDPKAERAKGAARWKVAEDAYRANQLALGLPQQWEDAELPDLHQETEVEGIPIFVLDTRSHRGVREAASVDSSCVVTQAWLDKTRAPRGDYQVLGRRQLCALEEWLATQKGSFIIVSNTPIFYDTRSRTTTIVEVINPEMRDDLRDAWGSRRNRSERDAIIEMLVKARRSGARPIVVSGDVHVSVPVTAWICDNAPTDTCATYPERADEKCQVLAYEMVTTGLSSEDFARKWLRGRNRSQVTNSARVDLTKVADRRIDVTVYEEVAAPNFGAIEFRSADETWLHHYEAEWDDDRVRLQRRSLRADFSRRRCADIECDGRGAKCAVRDPALQSLVIVD